MTKNSFAISDYSLSLNHFLSDWDNDYKKSTSGIDLFNQALTSLWTPQQKILFAKTFYHARGHFYHFLWFLGNFSTDKETKDIVLINLSEEFNSSAMSHEQMYIQFAESLGTSLENEILMKKIIFLSSKNLIKVIYVG